MKNFLIAVFAVVPLVILAPLFQGYTLSLLWEWFIVGKFTAIHIGVWNALGIVIIAKLFSVSYKNGDSKAKDGMSLNEKVALQSLVVIWASADVLLLGWIVHSLM